jgi:hypothetical protein
LAPGTFVNRALSAVICTVFSFSSTLCTVNLAKSSDRVVAATPPAVERNISDWLVQRDPGEFDDAPSVPPFPQDPGPNQPVRPDFDNPNPSNSTLPIDFTIASQKTLSSGRREIVLRSLSTGTEQILVTSSSEADNFELFEIELKNFSLTNEQIAKSILSSANLNDEEITQIKSVIKNFKISFKEKSVSRITLADGSMIDINQGQAVITLPNGQVQTIPINKTQIPGQGGVIGLNSSLQVSQISFSHLFQKIFSHKNKITPNKGASLYQLAQLSCENKVKAAYYSSATGLGILSGYLGTFATALPSAGLLGVAIKALLWGVTVAGSSLTLWMTNEANDAIKAISEKLCDRTAPQPQQTAQQPQQTPQQKAQCGQIQKEEGGQGSHKRDFNVGTNRGTVRVLYEMCRNPDQLDLLYEGKLIGTTGGLVSGSGSVSGNFEGSSNTVTVKMSAPNDGTGWAYVVLCPGQELPASIGKLRDCKG